MEKSIVINSKEYKVPEINFGAICKLEELGIDFQVAESKSFTFIRALVALTINSDIDTAGNEIEQHIINGGSLGDFDALVKSVGESDFFQSLTKKRKK